MQHVLHFHGFDHGDTIAFGHGLALAHEQLCDAPDDRRADAHVVARWHRQRESKLGQHKVSLAHAVEDIDGIAVADHERARNRGHLIDTIAANDARSAAPHSTANAFATPSTSSVTVWRRGGPSWKPS